MKINAVDNQTFGLHKMSKIKYNPNATKTIADVVQFENGKRFVVAKTFDKFGVMTEKLHYLKDSMGNWVKSKLQYFKDGKLIKELKGSRNA